ncbi:hypothetical protein H310_02395 [Aphanomyces invadans]|uniref:WW domain-containing protein n=1 Tax=Aphanomyces invadans TaxID=157072 RepID=A0A024UQB1_9STRA|nr:hypothetical protein H310_02395 [Aphanomyces invadans]ETW08017.1 hypothetical protein H310_02395 [Aphanomyces invadans]|eukprot:XP_008864110.1 hypothetical protein H310_02395 [Aphanomyces invadans]
MRKAALVGWFVLSCSALTIEELAPYSQFQEDLLLRNVHPFGIVFADPDAVPEQGTSPDGAFCATGEFGALEYWERVRQDGHVFFYCKARHTSQWQPPCIHLMPDFDLDADDPRRFPFPMSIERLDLSGAVKKEYGASADDNQAGALELGTPSDIPDDIYDGMPLLTYEGHIHDQFFTFHGYLDHLQGVSFRPHFHKIPRELHEEAVASLPKHIVVGNIDDVYLLALQDVVGLEVELEHVVREALEDDVPDPMMYTVSHFSVDQRKAVAAAWADLSTLALARANVTIAMNALRRSIYWLRHYHVAYMKMARVLSTLGYMDDACECLQILLDNEPDHVAKLRTEFSFCPMLHSRKTASILYHPVVMLFLQVGTLTVAFVLFVWWVKRQYIDSPPPPTTATDKRQRKAPHRGRHLK